VETNASWSSTVDIDHGRPLEDHGDPPSGCPFCAAFQVPIQCPRFADSVVAAANRHPGSVLQEADHALKAFPAQGRPGLLLTQKKHERISVESGDLELAPTGGCIETVTRSKGCPYSLLDSPIQC
jgi:hypothetical protein